jgi:uncharacterized tellurite resistance protein B-like protein
LKIFRVKLKKIEMKQALMICFLLSILLIQLRKADENVSSSEIENYLEILNKESGIKQDEKQKRGSQW